VPENDLIFRELLKKLLVATEQYGILIADESYSDRVGYMDVKKYVDKIIENYDTLKKERDELKEKYCDYLDEELK
jgi:hypothetical protein